MQIRTPLRYHFSPIKMAKVYKKYAAHFRQVCGEIGNLISGRWEYKLISLYGFVHIYQNYKDVGPLSQWLHLGKFILLMYKNNKSTRSFTAAVFVVKKDWKQPKYPSSGDWLINWWATWWNTRQLFYRWCRNIWYVDSKINL